jgi:D-lactate dehydrogenase (cytochrome)/glycolate oxidase
MSDPSPPEPPFVAALRAVLGREVPTDRDVLASVSRDQAPLAPAGQALALVRARSVDDVIATLRVASEHRVPVVTRGAGTGLAGGANAIDGCILLSVLGLDRILAIHEDTRTAVVEPGVLNAALAREVSSRGLFYAPDPASREISTLGGNIATNAGGSCCLKYGVTGDHVAALKVVLADGSLISTGSVVTKNVAGFDLKRLFVGSEGTLGVIVEATLRLRKRPPSPSTLVAFFDTMDAAAQAIVAIESAADPSLLEVMDRVTIGAVERHASIGLDTSAAAMILVQSDAADARASIERGEQICADHGARDVMRSDDPEEGKLLLTARRQALPALEKMGTTLLDDVGVPKPRLPALFAAIEQIAARHGLVIGTFGHAGDGNLHPTIVFDGQDERSVRTAHLAFAEIVRAAIDLGGTLAGEHGVGSLKEPYLDAMLGAGERTLMRRIKAAFDPLGILNPGKAI